MREHLYRHFWREMGEVGETVHLAQSLPRWHVRLTRTTRRLSHNISYIRQAYPLSSTTTFYSSKTSSWYGLALYATTVYGIRRCGTDTVSREIVSPLTWQEQHEKNMNNQIAQSAMWTRPMFTPRDTD